MQLVVMRNPDGTTALHVADDGPGIESQDAGKLFEPFFTTAARGTGLGLYIARELAVANGAVLEYLTPEARDARIGEMTGLAGADFRLLFAAPVRGRFDAASQMSAASPATASPQQS